MSPDKDVIHQFLSLLTEPWKECSPKGQLDLRFLANGKKTYTARFADDQLMDATDHIVKMNIDNLIAYVCINPVAEIALKVGIGATDEDILRAHFAFADCDEAGAAERLKNSAPPHDFCVVTGTQPHLRCHYYWQFDRALHDLAKWRVIQAGFAKAYGWFSEIRFVAKRSLLLKRENAAPTKAATAQGGFVPQRKSGLGIPDFDPRNGRSGEILCGRQRCSAATAKKCCVSSMAKGQCRLCPHRSR